MRIPILLTLLAATPALAAEPASCQVLSDAEVLEYDARVELARLSAMAFGDEFKRRIGYVDADKREELVAQREEARRSLPEARRLVREARVGKRDAKKTLRTEQIACLPPAEDDSAA